MIDSLTVLAPTKKQEQKLEQIEKNVKYGFVPIASFAYFQSIQFIFGKSYLTFVVLCSLITPLFCKGGIRLCEILEGVQQKQT